jgi:electron transfer flavoprotein beta subunit
MEGGARQHLEIQLPAVLAIQTGINQPRYPSLSNLLKANRYKIETVDSTSFPCVAPRQSVVETSHPPKTRDVRLLAGSLDEKARELYRILNKKGFLNHDR